MSGATREAASEACMPTCYAITSKGIAMPGHLISSEDHLATVAAPSGREYTFPVDCVLSVEEAEHQLRQDRVAAVLNGYSFRMVARGTVRTTGAPVASYRVSHPTNGRRSYVVTTGAIEGCSCPGYQKRHECKHLQAVRSQEETEAPEESPAESPAAPKTGTPAESPAAPKTGTPAVSSPEYLAARAAWAEQARQDSGPDRDVSDLIAPEDW